MKVAENPALKAELKNQQEEKLTKTTDILEIQGVTQSLGA